MWNILCIDTYDSVMIFYTFLYIPYTSRTASPFLVFGVFLFVRVFCLLFNLSTHSLPPLSHHPFPFLRSPIRLSTSVPIYHKCIVADFSLKKKGHDWLLSSELKFRLRHTWLAGYNLQNTHRIVSSSLTNSPLQQKNKTKTQTKNNSSQLMRHRNQKKKHLHRFAWW